MGFPIRRAAAFRVQPAGSSPAMAQACASRYSVAMDRRSLYDDDIYAWAQQQAEVLRRLAETGRDLPNELDLENVAEEIEDVGKSELREVESFIRLMFIHLIKAASAPEARSYRKWEKEIRVLRADLLKNLTRSMQAMIDVNYEWKLAAIRADADLSDHGDQLLPELPAESPFSLDDLIGESFDFEKAVAQIRKRD
ncbi:MAG TPA: DUF29 domain-containing protein [Beijerinckiaceae bacterium]|jgi:hypothetical protein|nr:DUF29 domain-containing protein [Beijerinckiaceae bacterium]